MKTLILHYPKLSIIIALLGLASSGNLFSRDINAKSSKDLTLPIDIQYYMNKYVRVYEDDTTLTKAEKKALKKEERAEKRAQVKAERIEKAKATAIDNPNNASYVLLGKDLPHGRGLIDVLSGRVPGLVSSGENVMVHGPNSFYGGMTPLFLVDDIEVSKEYINSMPIEDIERIEVFTGPSAAFFGSRAGNAVISIYTKYSMNQLKETDE